MAVKTHDELASIRNTLTLSRIKQIIEGGM